MKISKNIVTSVLAVVVSLSIMIITLLYANQYTSSHAAINNSFQKGRRGMPSGQFQNKGSNKFQGGPPNGDFKKPGN